MHLKICVVRILDGKLTSYCSPLIYLMFLCDVCCIGLFRFPEAQIIVSHYEPIWFVNDTKEQPAFPSGHVRKISITVCKTLLSSGGVIDL